MAEGIVPTTFTSTLLESIAPWNDSNGFWVGYNTALGTMAEQVYSLISDQGDLTEAVIATTTTDLLAGVVVTTLHVTPLIVPLSTGAGVIVVSPGSPGQTWEVTAPAAEGATTISVDGRTPNGLWPWDNTSLPAGSQVQQAYVPGWSRLLDPYACPDQFLTYLGQLAGVPLSPITDVVVARDLLLSRHAHDRGTLYSITSAVQANLTGTQSVGLLERTNPSGASDGYWFIVIVRPEEVVSVQALTDAVNSVKPGGVLWQLIQTDAWIISQMEAQYASITLLEAAFASITALEQGPLPRSPTLTETVTTADVPRVRYPFAPILRDAIQTTESVSAQLA